MPTRPDPARSASPEEAAGPQERMEGEDSGRNGRPEARDLALVGRRVDKYEIVRVIGRGGMGTVYEALNTTINKRVAMKFLDAYASQQRDSIVRFQREAQAASAVESPHIVEIFDAGTSDEGLPFIVMELLRGEDLGHRIRRCGRLEIEEALGVTAHILRGLRCAHDAGIVHRDLKPDNIFLVEREDDPCFAKLLDFGISKVRRAGSASLSTLTRKGTVLGTPFYMSPEQAQAQPDVDGRADLWSVGAILYEALTGRPPYVGTTYEQVIVSICMNDAPDVRRDNPAVPAAVAEVIATALRRDRDERFPSAQAFLQGLKAAAGHVVSSRSPLAVSDDLPSRGASSSIRALSRLSPNPTPPQAAISPLDDTLEVRSTPHGVPGSAPRPRSMRRRRRPKRQSRTTVIALVAGGALVVGGLGAFLVERVVRPGGRLGEPAASASISVSFSPPPTSTGSLGEARGPSASPTVTPAVAATAPDTSEPKKTTPKATHVPSLAPASPSPSLSKSASRPADPAPTSGVAPGLRLKTD